MENLVTTLTSDMERIWDTISKPTELKDRQLRDYFDLSFTTLSHKLLRPDAFEADINRLRGRFTDKTREDYVFKPGYHKRIPADGVAFYMEGVWVRISRSRWPFAHVQFHRNKCNRTRTSIYPHNKSSWPSSDAMKFLLKP